MMVLNIFALSGNKVPKEGHHDWWSGIKADINVQAVQRN
jgi:hypothetical protein